MYEAITSILANYISIFYILKAIFFTYFIK